jgi:hypothetical protein
MRCTLTMRQVIVKTSLNRTETLERASTDVLHPPSEHPPCTQALRLAGGAGCKRTTGNALSQGARCRKGPTETPRQTPQLLIGSAMLASSIGHISPRCCALLNLFTLHSSHLTPPCRPQHRTHAGCGRQRRRTSAVRLQPIPPTTRPSLEGLTNWPPPTNPAALQG